VYFSRSILPQRFDSIRVLSLDWGLQVLPYSPDNGISAFKEIWGIVASMKSLKRLHVKAPWRCCHPQLYSIMHESLMKVKGLTVFELAIPGIQRENLSWTVSDDG
jgi:hypothetical protein